MTCAQCCTAQISAAAVQYGAARQSLPRARRAPGAGVSQPRHTPRATRHAPHATRHARTAALPRCRTPHVGRSRSAVRATPPLPARCCIPPLAPGCARRRPPPQLLQPPQPPQPLQLQPQPQVRSARALARAEHTRPAGWGFHRPGPSAGRPPQQQHSSCDGLRPLHGRAGLLRECERTRLWRHPDYCAARGPQRWEQGWGHVCAACRRGGARTRRARAPPACAVSKSAAVARPSPRRSSTLDESSAAPPQRARGWQHRKRRGPTATRASIAAHSAVRAARAPAVRLLRSGPAAPPAPCLCARRTCGCAHRRARPAAPARVRSRAAAAPERI